MGLSPPSAGVEGGFEAGEREVLCGFARESLRDRLSEQEHREACTKRVQGETTAMVGEGWGQISG